MPFWAIFLIFVCYCSITLSIPSLVLYDHFATRFPDQDNVFSRILYYLVIFLYQVFFLWVLLLHRWWFRIMAIILVVLGAIHYTFTNYYGVCVDQDMIHNILNTNVHEVTELFTPGLIWNIIIFALPAVVLLLLVRITPVSGWRWWVGVLMTPVLSFLLLIVILYGLPSNIKDVIFSVKGQINCTLFPANSIVGSIRNIRDWQERRAIERTPRAPIDAAATIRSEDSQLPLLVVLVIGETARAKNYSLNGYERETNPLLRSEDIINYPHASSCGTYTLLSVPCIFSPKANPESYKRNNLFSQENALQFWQRLGISVQWVANNSIIPALMKDIPNQKVSSKLYQTSACIRNACYDEVFVEDLTKRLSQSLPKRHSLLVYHLLGNHFAYESRVPKNFKYFTPICKPDKFSSCSPQEILNSYDNAIRYNDYVLAQLIATLRSHDNKTQSILLYTSDHGESLGERGIWFHGLPYSIAPKEQTHVPLMFWMSKSFRSKKPQRYQCLKEKSSTLQVSHEFIFHTLVTIFSIATKRYSKPHDLLASC
ncbi:MAG: sulfatase-like hydrolase/transferase [Methylacidiphilales bacterium]|nr:sulfatase-like hydrolase/transferase [Candidatus Methylacidiphilales bacterium]